MVQIDHDARAGDNRVAPLFALCVLAGRRERKTEILSQGIGISNAIDRGIIRGVIDRDNGLGRSASRSRHAR